MRYLYIFIFLTACSHSKPEYTAQEIVNKSIYNAGVHKIKNSTVTFKFRDKNYKAVRDNGNFKLIRSYDSIKDILTNTGFERIVNKKRIILSDSLAKNYANSVNSVHYFSVLPYGLNDKAVKKRLLKPSTIKGKEYYKIEISFSEDGGGEDFEDVFIYWIDKENFLIDYLAYSYHTNGGGKRFRVLKEQCVKNGVRFVDYHNYKPNNKDILLIDLDRAFENNELTKVSEIILKNIEVEIN